MQKEKRYIQQNQYIQFDPNAVNNYNTFLQKIEESDEPLRTRVLAFKYIQSFNEAKSYLHKNFSVCKPELTIVSEDGKCNIIVKSNKIRISYKSTSEFFCFDFENQKENKL